MLANHIYNLLINNFGFSPTDSQKNAFIKISDFLCDFKDSSVLLIKGYAGTGKTSLVNSIVKTMDEFDTKSVLMAPTGRAAKILNFYTQKNAFTIHKIIYRQNSAKDGIGSFVLNFNKFKDTIFIVDEASMINDRSFESSVFGSGNLLKDLLSFVSSGAGCRLLLIGDTAQLPPVGLDTSPGLDRQKYQEYGYSAHEVELTEIIRQSKESGILYNATILRNQINKNLIKQPCFKINGYTDITRIDGSELLEAIESSYNKFGIENVIVINRSNKLANKYNQGIRNRILSKEENLSGGDLLMVVKNNYFWFEQTEEAEFIANGDIVELTKIYNTEEIYGFNFANVNIRLPDFNNIELKVKLNLESINSESASLSGEQNKNLYLEVAADYPEIKNKRKLQKEIRENPYFNALQVKFAYAVTCHKAQGGQWKAAFIDQGFFSEKMISYEYLRWLYTAFTRPIEQLYLVNFPDSFFE
ncbi:MAG: AAA family ATPase [Bacteroidota bacterium]